MFKFLLATNNEHKLKEFKDIFKNYDVQIYSLKDLEIEVSPLEDGNTFYENALIKCKACKDFTTLPIVSDDSGIIIDSLGENFPGIYSQRYMEKMGGQKRCLEYLEKNHQGSKAKFHCSIVILNLEKEPIEFVGEVNGTISKIVKWCDFGYDPIFKINSIQKTFSELDPKTKDKMSHRYLASQKFLNYLKDKNYI